MGAAAAPREGPLSAQLKGARSAALSCAIMSSETQVEIEATAYVSIEEGIRQGGLEQSPGAGQIIIARQKMAR
jgi:hypothetical protein